MKKKLIISYQDIISTENLLLAWQEFSVGKRSKKDVIEFELNLADNILHLHQELASGIYKHGGYHDFFIADPKLRHIHKARVRDRLIHHAIYRQLYPFFDKTFISNSYSCRLDKGTHRAITAFNKMARQASVNNIKTCWVLQCDIKKFFDSIDHEFLLDVLKEYIFDTRILLLLDNIINSYESSPGCGLPLGNLTSQLLVNIYMNKFDQFVKHEIKAKYYIRYADDFVFISDNKEWLILILPLINRFLAEELHLKLHPQKTHINTSASGIDFLGWVNFTEHKTLRTKTKKRMMSRIINNSKPESLASYLEMLKHGNACKIKREVINNYWLNFKS
ncbi:MAG: reverse transcriptase/maturase family protein [Bacilli bacterium]|nr:reverse transcriptase/maturase family protein [Bacilli bacterium]